MTTNAELLRTALAELGLTQEEAALRVGMAREQFNKYATGYQNLGPQNARRIEQRLGLPDGYFTISERNSDELTVRLDRLAEELSERLTEIEARLAALERERDEELGPPGATPP